MNTPRRNPLPPAVAAGLVAALALALAPRAVEASFHFMQIEQILGGVDGSTATQAIQLRMRQGGQNLVSNGRLLAHDAAGANPVLLIDFTTNVAISTAGSRVLVASANFSAATNPAVTPDFTFTNPIPASYLPAGSISFESDGGIPYWVVCWGGAAFTGPTTGSGTNDADANFAPIYAAELPSSSGQALHFKFAANALSTNNANDYEVTAGSAVLTNNAGASGTVISLVSVPAGPAEGLALAGPIPNPAQGSFTYFVTLPRAMDVGVDVFDIRGRRKGALHDGPLPAGRSSLSWDRHAAGVPALGAGVYFLVVTAGGQRRTARCVLLDRGALAPEPNDE